jgi:predicted adenylyl cyclase CyaB
MTIIAAYNPRDRDLSLTGESLRIREEGRYRALGYKGPKRESKYREKAKIEFEIDEETREMFLTTYGDSVKSIKKERVLYHLDGIVFSIDTVSRVEKGKTVDFGTFVEIRTVKKGTSQPEIDEVLSKMGLNPERGTKESYVEM